MSRKSKLIDNKTDIEFLLNIKEDDVTSSFIMEVFGEFAGKSRFKPYDLIEIPVNSYGTSTKNKNKFTTTVGLWIFNKYFIENDLFDQLKYINYTINKSTFGKINSILSSALLEDRLELSVFKRYLMKTQKFMPYVSILSPSQTLKMLTITKQLDKMKKELVKKYDKEVKAGDPIIAEKIESELLNYAKEILKDDPSMDSYNSGARGSWGNNFKNIYVMKGAIKDPDPNKGYNIALSNYRTGISKEEYGVFANSLSAGPYSRAAKTAIGGYWEKLFTNAYQHVILDKEGSDCKTDKYITVDFSEQNISDYIYSYVIQGSQLIEINSENMSKFDKKVVKLRFSSMCKSKTGICNKCAGNLYYKLGITNVGMTIPIVASTLKNLCMKNFHDSSVKTIEIDPMKAFNIK